MPVDFVALFSTLTMSGVRFVVVGGLAAVLHGVDRLTADVDVVVDLDADRMVDAIRAITAAGYRPMAPVDPVELADPDKRGAWQRDKGMKVFSFWDSTAARPTVDVLLECPIPFAELWRDSIGVPIGDLQVRIASREHLIRMKAASGRARDMEDIARLRDLGESS